MEKVDPPEQTKASATAVTIPLTFTVDDNLGRMMADDENICAGTLVQCFKEQLKALTTKVQEALEQRYHPCSIILPGTRPTLVSGIKSN